MDTQAVVEELAKLDATSLARVKRLTQREFYREHSAEARAIIEEQERVLPTLGADYIREYMCSVLELCPTDYFTVAEDGAWCIDPEAFRAMPREVKRLVESVDARRVGGQLIFHIKFVSKTAMLNIAARHMFTQKTEVAVTQVPWDEIATQAGAPDAIEQRILDVQTAAPARDAVA